MENKYTVDYFIEKFNKTPDKWATAVCINNKGECCAFGQLGNESIAANELNDEGKALVELFSKAFDVRGVAAVYQINDAENPVTRSYGLMNEDHLSDLGSTPKERILTALELIKAGVSV